MRLLSLCLLLLVHSKYFRISRTFKLQKFIKHVHVTCKILKNETLIITFSGEIKFLFSASLFVSLGYIRENIKLRKHSRSSYTREFLVKERAFKTG